ncbi:MAG: DUF192 domain-containing protein [Chloroflexota bacterium]|nr:DUF192 domain-containing protein [Chloroflexota bacterium]
MRRPPPSFVGKGGGGLGRLSALLLLLLLAACTAPTPPALGTPGIDLKTPLPAFLPATATVPPSATPPPATASLAPPVVPTPSVVVTATPADAAAQPTADHALPSLVITPTQGSTVRLYIEIADTPIRQERGLMNRTTMAEDQGMIFVFPAATDVAFWMHDTLLPLSIAFIDANRRIVDLQDMQPLDETLHSSAQPYVYALEVNQGYFRRHGIAVGDAVSLPPFPATPTPEPLQPLPTTALTPTP